MTKRQLGILFIITGLAAAAGMLLIDLTGAGRFAGIGPVQRLALGGAALIVVIGCTLLPLGDRPA